MVQKKVHAIIDRHIEGISRTELVVEFTLISCDFLPVQINMKKTYSFFNFLTVKIRRSTQC